MVTLKQLIEFQKNGLFNIKINPDGMTADLNGMVITMEQAVPLVSKMGWIEYKLSPFEIISKTGKFTRGLKGVIPADIAQEMCIELQNRYTGDQNKTFDRIHIVYRRELDVAINYNMPGSAAVYVIYNTQTSVPLKKCRNLKQVGIGLMELL